MAAKLTDVAIRNAKPKAKPYKLAAGRGLTLVVMPNGARYWRLRYRYGGKEKWLSVGKPYPATMLRSAEAEADKLRAKLASGIDPAEERLQVLNDRRYRVANTFGEAAEAWFEFRGKAWSARTSAQVRAYLDKDLLPALSHRPLANVTTKELASLAERIANRGAPDVAKKVRQWLGSIYGFVPPAVELPRTPGEWESFDITLVGRTVTVVRNGKLTIDHQEIPSPTGGALDSRESEPGPIYLQGDHTGGMKYRNITISVPED